jgi:ABC-2 type transport system ATP-binding protein
MAKALSIKNLSKTYANGKKALNEISFDVDEGDFFALLGPNGAGKSTTIGIVTSLINKTSGDIKIFDYDLAKNPVNAKSLIGLVPQEFNFNIFEKVTEVLLTQAGYYGIPKSIAHPRVEKYLNDLGLWEQRNNRIRFLSGGMKRRLLIARALIHAPQLLILDEPTAGVDIELRRLLWDFIVKLNQSGVTIILTTHYLEEAEQLCRNIGIIHQGNLIEYASMRDLLKKLHVESFILYLKSPINNDKIISSFNYTCRIIDEMTLEIDLKEHQNLSDLIQDLYAMGYVVQSMRNKVNRLEELFLRLTAL